MERGNIFSRDVREPVEHEPVVISHVDSLALKALLEAVSERRNIPYYSDEADRFLRLIERQNGTSGD